MVSRVGESDMKKFKVVFGIIMIVVLIGVLRLAVYLVNSHKVEVVRVETETMDGIQADTGESDEYDVGLEDKGYETETLEYLGSVAGETEYIGQSSEDANRTSDYEYVSDILNITDTDSKCADLLGDKYENYADMISDLRMLYLNICSSLPSELEYNSADSKLYDISGYSDILDEIENSDYSSFVIGSGLKIIYALDGNHALCVFDLNNGNGKEAFVVDLSDTRVSPNVMRKFDVGDELSVKGSRGYYTVKEIDGFRIMFLKSY